MKKHLLIIVIIFLLLSSVITPMTIGINIKTNLKSNQITIEGTIFLHQDNYYDFLPFDHPISFKINTYQFEQSEVTILKKEPSTFDNGILEVVSSESDGDSQGSSIAIDNEGTIHVTWCDTAEYENASDGGLYDIFYKFKPIDGGWSAAEVVTPESSIYNNVASVMDVDSFGNVHVAWWIAKNDDNYYPICYKMKPKDGEWSDTEFVPLDTYKNCDVHLNIDSEDTVHIVWCGSISEIDERPDIFYIKKPYGESWSTYERVSTELGASYFPHVAGGTDGSAHIAWSDNANYQSSGFDFDLFYKMKPKDGDWSATEVVSTDSSGNCQMSYITIGPDVNVHVSWSEIFSLTFSSKIYYRMKSNSGSWSEKEEITEKCWAYTPWLFADESGTVHFVFDSGMSEAYNPDPECSTVFYRKKLDDGSWSHVEVISLESMLVDEAGGGIPRIVVENNNLHFFWTDNLNYLGCGDDNDIFYKMKTIDDNQYPEKPTISGPRVVKDGTHVDYTFSTTDLEGDDLYYCIWLHSNLGLLDSFILGWLGPYASGEELTVDIPFFSRPGISWVKAKAVDVNGGLSDIGTFTVIVTRDKASNNIILLQRFLERFPNVFPILKYILG